MKDPYFDLTVARFEKAFSPWFSLDQTRLISKDMVEMKLLLEAMVKVGNDSIVEFEDGCGFDYFSHIWHENGKLQIGQEKFSQLEQKYREYFELSPKWLLGLYNSCNAYQNFIAINSEDVKMEDFSSGKNDPHSMPLGNGLLIISPRGSYYNTDDKSKKDLIVRLKSIKI